MIEKGDATDAAWEASLERWVQYERENALANMRHFRLDEGNLYPPEGLCTVTMPREMVTRFRSAHALLVNAMAEVVGKPGAELTMLDVILFMRDRAMQNTEAWEKREACLRELDGI